MSKKFQVFLLASSILIIGFALVGGLGVHASDTPKGAYDHIQVYSEVLYHVRAEYVEEPNMSAVTKGALHGLLESLDANSSYLSPDEYKAFKQKKTTGKANIGATISKRFGYAAIISVIPGGPADKAGLSSGDILESVDGQSTHDLSLAAVKARLVGDSGSRLDCAVIRARKVEPQKITIVREEVKPPAVQQQMLPDEIGYIKSVVLTKGKAAEIESKIKDLQKNGAKKLVLDLRNDSDGDEEEGVAVANLFLDHGVIASLQGQKYTKVTYNAEPQKKVTDLPLVVLVNRGTASAAEIVSGAIQDHDRGLIVGEVTFGKGLVQTVYPLSENTGLALTTAKYYTPSGRLIQRDYNNVSLYDYYYAREQEDNPNNNANTNSATPAKEVKLTDSGRTMFGGGGITPDVKVKPFKTTHFEDSLLVKYAFFNFAKHYLGNRHVDKNFEVTDAVMQDFRKFLDSQKIPYTEADLTEGIDYVRSSIKTELFISEFGQEEGLRVRAENDPQVVAALNQLPKAKELAENARKIVAQRAAEAQQQSNR